MKLYFAGSENSNDYNPILTRCGVKSRLISYFYIDKKNFMEKDMFENIFVDSGAFSAYTREAVIDIDDYIAFIKHYRKDITVYANLDAIGDAKASLYNYEYMCNAGLHPLPVFHQGEDFSYLRKYLEETEYIALGGMVGSNA